MNKNIKSAKEESCEAIFNGVIEAIEETVMQMGGRPLECDTIQVDLEHFVLRVIDDRKVVEFRSKSDGSLILSVTKESPLVGSLADLIESYTDKFVKETYEKIDDVVESYERVINSMKEEQSKQRKVINMLLGED